MSIQSAVDN